jgi:hypothetical protein
LSVGAREFGAINHASERRLMRIISIVLLFFLPLGAFAQSPFDGTWVIDMNTVQLPDKPVVYLLDKGMFHCGDCGQTEIKADGHDEKVAETGYRDTLSVRIIDDRTVEIVTKKAGKPMFTEIYTVSEDGGTLHKVVKDTTESQAVTIEMVSARLEPGPEGAHALSGSWRMTKMSRSENGSIVTYKCTADEFIAKTELGEGYAAKFDGEFYPVEDDPGHTLVSARRMSPTTVELTFKRDGKIVAISRLTTVADGNTIHVFLEDKENNTDRSYEMRRRK